jgi:hypothetical protein
MMVIEGARPEYRTASKASADSSLSHMWGCQNPRQARLMVGLSLDHLWLPSDKSPNQ